MEEREIPQEMLDVMKERERFFKYTIEQLKTEPDLQMKEFALIMTYIENLEKTILGFKETHKDDLLFLTLMFNLETDKKVINKILKKMD